MTNEPLDADDFDFWEQSDSDWAPPLTSPVGEVRGSKWLVGGYNALEEIQRRVRLDAMSHHMKETHNWYKGLTLYFVAQYGEWDLSPMTPDEEFQARGVQMDLLGLGLSSAKVSIDCLLAGYYSAAFATIRHMTETVLQSFYLQAFPDRAFLWRSEPTEENVKRMGAKRLRDKLVKRMKTFQPESERQAITEYIEGVFHSWELLSIGAHPSSGGLSQVVAPPEQGGRQVGSGYTRYLTLYGFDHGFFALQGLLEQLEYMDRVNDEWRRRFDHWRDYVADFRMNLATDPAVVDFTAKMEAARQAREDAERASNPDDEPSSDGGEDTSS